MLWGNKPKYVNQMQIDNVFINLILFDFTFIRLESYMKIKVICIFNTVFSKELVSMYTLRDISE